MDFALSPRAQELQAELLAFMDSHVYPAEPVYASQMEASGDPSFHPPIVEELKAEARSRGLWNLFLPDEEWGSGVSVLDYATLAEITGRSPNLAPEALNCSAPDTGNMEILTMFGTPEQKERWLRPLLDAEIRSAFSMTEPDVGSSDASNIRTQIRPDGDDYVVSGRKWWSSGAFSSRCAFTIVMGVTNPDNPPYQRQSMIIVPLDTPGVEVERDLTVLGYRDRGGHPVIHFDKVRVPKENLLGIEGGGFAIAQARSADRRARCCPGLDRRSSDRPGTGSPPHAQNCLADGHGRGSGSPDRNQCHQSRGSQDGRADR